MIRIRTLHGFFVAASLLLAPESVVAQAPAGDDAVLRGRVADGADNAVAGAVVLLHAVTGQAGVEVDRDTADENGAFELRFTPEDGPLYFVATRVGGEIFMGEPFRGAPPGEVVLRAGPGVEPLRMDAFENAPAVVSGARGAARTRGHGGWWVALIGAVIAGSVAWLVHRGRQRAPRARELMVEIARLDERRADAAARGAAAVSGDEAYRARRAELRDRLVEALELDHDADRH